MDGDTDKHNMLVYSKEFEKVYYIYHFNCYITSRIISSVFYRGWNKITSMPLPITDRIIPLVYSSS